MSIVGRLMAWFGALIALLAVFAFVGVIGSCLIVLAIWPGELLLLEPILCTDAQPDAFVVTDTYQSGAGETSTDFTMYCMGPRGDATDIGFMKPFLIVSAINGIILMVPLVLLGIVGRISFGRRVDRIAGINVRSAKVWTAEFDSAADVAGSEEPTPEPHLDGADPFDRPPELDADRRPDDGRSRPPPGSTAGPFID